MQIVQRRGKQRFDQPTRLFAVALMTIGCATAKKNPLPPNSPHAAPTIPSASSAASDPESNPRSEQTGATISRPRLLAILERGIPAFLATVDVDPVVELGRFKGWLWKGWRQPVTAAGLEPGDLLVAANGESLERPESFTRVWQALRKATAIDLDVVRKTGPTKLHYDIVP